MKDKAWAILSTLPFIMLYLAFAVAPIIWILINSFSLDAQGYGLDNFKSIIFSEFYRQSIRLSLKISFYSSLIGILLGFITSYSIYALKPAKIVDIIMSFNSAMMNFVGVPLAFAFIVILGTNGVLNLVMRQFGITELVSTNSQLGVTIIYVYFQIPLAILLLFPAFNSLKPEYHEAATLLGAGRLNYWCRIVLPLLLPAILASFIILFANALGAYATIYALNSSFNIIPIRIASLVSGDIFLDPYVASALSVLLLIIMLLMATIQRWLLNRYSFNYQ